MPDPKSLLLVDDDPNIQETAKDILEDAGYRVRAVGSCAAALQALASAPADIAIIDFNLPDGTALELAVKIRAIAPKLVLFLLTGETNPPLGQATVQFQAVLIKPVNPAHLIAIIQKNS